MTDDDDDGEKTRQRLKRWCGGEQWKMKSYYPMNESVDQKTNLASKTWWADDFLNANIYTIKKPSSFLIKSPRLARRFRMDYEWNGMMEKKWVGRQILKLMSLNRYTTIVPHHKHEKEITEMFMLLFPLLRDLWQFFPFFLEIMLVNCIQHIPQSYMSENYFLTKSIKLFDVVI